MRAAAGEESAAIVYTGETDTMKIQRLVAVAAMAFGASFAAHAADLYALGSVGASKWNVSDIAGASLDKSDTGFKLGIGGQFSPNLAVEGGYADLGKAKLTASGGSGSIKGNGVFVDVVGLLPLSPQFNAFGKVGVFNGHAKAEASGVGGRASESDSGTDVKFGLGLSYAVSKTVQVRGEWERYRFKVWGDKGDVDLLSVGVTFGF